MFQEGMVAIILYFKFFRVVTVSRTESGNEVSAPLLDGSMTNRFC